MEDRAVHGDRSSRRKRGETTCQAWHWPCVPRRAGGSGGRAGHRGAGADGERPRREGRGGRRPRRLGRRLTENGVARDITSFKPDARPLSVAVLVDTSAAAGSDLPPEPGRRGGRADRAASRTGRATPCGRRAIVPRSSSTSRSDRRRRPQALQRVAPQGGNTVLDALSRGLGGPRRSSRARATARSWSR